MIFKNKFYQVRAAQEVLKMAQKLGFQSLGIYLIHSYVLIFPLNVKVLMVYSMSGKNLVLDSGVPGHTHSYAKQWLSSTSRMSWAIKLSFCMCLGIHRSYKFFQSFLAGVFKHVQTDWKQGVSYKCIYMIHSIHISMIRYTWVCQN